MPSRATIALVSLLLPACGGNNGSVGLFGEDSGGADATSASETSGVTAASQTGGTVDDSGGTTATGADDGSTGGIKFDTQTDAPIDPGGDCGCGNDEWSYIWIANSSEGTVSKVNTRTLEEEGRYQTRPDGAGSPSRTSVSLGGRAVAVASRHGGVVKIWAREQFCDPMKNGTAGLQTSMGAADVLAWDDDDCVAWYTPFPDYTTQRPIAWGGNVNPQTCDDEAVWTAGCGGGFSPGFGGGGNVFAHRLNGSDGTVEETIEVNGFGCGGFGAYGGAIDSDGNFWISHNGTGGKLGVVYADTLDFEVYDFPAGGFAGYGITVDNAGRPWVSSYGGNLGAGRFDPATMTWATVPGFASQGGIQQSEDGRIWVTTVQGFNGGMNQNGIVWVDADTAMVGEYATVSGGTVKGLSVDVDGFVWAVTGVAHKIDPATLVDDAAYSGLSGPYTYSDMTGWGLQNNVCNPAG